MRPLYTAINMLINVCTPVCFSRLGTIQPRPIFCNRIGQRTDTKLWHAWIISLKLYLKCGNLKSLRLFHRTRPGSSCVWQQPCGSERLQHPRGTTPAEWEPHHTSETSRSSACGPRCQHLWAAPHTKICATTLPKATSRCGQKPSSASGKYSEDSARWACEAEYPVVQGVDGMSDWLLPPSHIRSTRRTTPEHQLPPKNLEADVLGPTYIPEVSISTFDLMKYFGAVRSLK